MTAPVPARPRSLFRRLALLSPLALGLAFGAHAEDSHSGHMMTPATATADAATATADAAPSTTAFIAANAKMHADMAVPYTGDADIDFVRGMIPHHQGAVDMAKIVLENGDDPEVRKLAQGVIAAQEAEILWMTDWLKKHGQP